jgi:arsenate reductase-like glutaredoxin family protein
MTSSEFDNYNRGIAYQVERFNREKISKDELIEALEAHIGTKAFKETREIMDRKK